MSSQRRGNPRNNQRGASNDELNAHEMWGEVLAHIRDIEKGEAKAAANRESVIEGEIRLAAKKDAGKGISVVETDAHSALFREGLRLSEQQVARLKDGITAKLELIRDMVREKEKSAAAAAEILMPNSRSTSSRAANFEYDVPLDSPGPLPAENRHVRKLGPSRTGSIPPTKERPESITSEASERFSKPKVVYAVAEKVAFKRKQQGSKTDDQEWILGEVSRVIGEGKSRRYEVTDPFPDPGGSRLYKSSASQMVPIPSEKQAESLEDYEIGKRVLALYPDTSAFYRAEVKGILEGGAKVQLLFEDEVGGELRIVERRYALDHKG